MLFKFFKRFKTEDSSVSKQQMQRLSKYQQAQKAVQALRGIKSFNAIRAASVYVQSQDKNVVELHSRLQKYVMQLKDGANITQVMCFGELSTKTLDEFFTSSDGYYVTAGSIEILCDQMQTLFAMLEAKRAVESDTAAYTERLLSKTFTTFITLQEAVSQAKTLNN